MLRIVSRRVRLLGGLLVLAALASCAVKDSTFFTFPGTGGTTTTGGIHVVVTGIPGGAPVTLSGEEGFIGTKVVGEAGDRFAPLLGGTYSVSIAVPMGYSCDKTSTDLSYTASDTDAEVSFSCMAAAGTVTFTSTGISGSTSFGLSLMDGTTLSGSLGSSGATFTGVHAGDWSWQLGSTTGYTCTPMNGSFTLQPGGSYSQAIACTPDTGTLSVTVTGTGMTHTVTYTGPENGSVQAGESPGTATVMPGSYTLTLGSIDGYDCPSSMMASVTAGQTASVAFACTPQPGTITITQTGAPTASVAYSGPSASGTVDANDGAPALLDNLAAGAWTLTITDPDGYTCTPASIPVTLAPGGNESANFTCAPSMPPPTEVTYGIGDIQASPGVVPAGTYSVGLYDGAIQVGTGHVISGGGASYIGFSPTRLGLGAGGSYIFPVTSLTVSGAPFPAKYFQFCGVNGAISGSQPLTATYLDGSMSSLGTLDLTSPTGCVEGTMPTGTESVKLEWTYSGSIDFHGVRIRHD